MFITVRKKDVAAGEKEKHREGGGSWESCATVAAPRRARRAPRRPGFFALTIMGFRKISTDLLAASVRIHRRGRDTKEENATVCDISKRTLERALVRVRETGTVAHRAPRARGRPKKVLQEDIDYLVRISRYKPSTFLRE
jgi:hypothetical protein